MKNYLRFIINERSPESAFGGFVPNPHDEEGYVSGFSPDGSLQGGETQEEQLVFKSDAQRNEEGFDAEGERMQAGANSEEGVLVVGEAVIDKEEEMKKLREMLKDLA